MSDKVSPHRLNELIHIHSLYRDTSPTDAHTERALLELKAARAILADFEKRIQSAMHFLTDRLGDDDFNNVEAILANGIPYPTEVSVLEDQLKAARAVLDGLLFSCYADHDERMASTLDEYARDADYVIGDEFEVDEVYQKTKKFKIIGGGPTLTDDSPLVFEEIKQPSVASAENV